MFNVDPLSIIPKKANLLLRVRERLVNKEDIEELFTKLDIPHVVITHREYPGEIEAYIPHRLIGNLYPIIYAHLPVGISFKLLPIEEYEMEEKLNNITSWENK